MSLNTYTIEGEGPACWRCGGRVWRYHAGSRSHLRKHFGATCRGCGVGEGLWAMDSETPTLTALAVAHQAHLNSFGASR